ncbi:hypothetical protein [Fluviicola taffensis]|uniref:hypothetical protein n=1 Tax=Fluviicola taffensis TaxID=191579 RepID=UPI003137C6CC
MKTKITIGVLTAAVIALSIILFRTLSERKEKVTETKELVQIGSNEKSADSLAESSSAQLDEKLRKILCASLLIANDGEEISSQVAAREIQAFEDLYATDNVKAFHMGLIKLDAMLTKAKQYNTTQEGTQNPIIGFRFYRAISTRTLGGGLQINNKFDMVIYPTLSIDQDLTSGPIYGHTRPCPKLCTQ